MKSFQRFSELDLWRGMAIIAMVIFHFSFLQDFLNNQSILSPQGGWFLLARSIQWSFLLLVGISLNLSWQKNHLKGGADKIFLKTQLKRSLAVFGCGMIITLTTWIVIPSWYTVFGILHMIGGSIFLLRYLAGQPRISLLLSGVIYLFSFWVHNQSFDHVFWTIFGFRVSSFQSLDYFPLFPWMAIPALGIWMGSIFYKGYQRQIPFLEVPDSKIFHLIEYLGKKTLVIYMIHIPILLGLIYLGKAISAML